MDTLLKKPEILRDSEGRFERRGEGLIKKHGIIKKPANNPNAGDLPARGPGRPKGSKNKTSMALREQILASLDRVGGIDYLSKLALENSSAYASLLGKVLGNTHVPESSGGVKVTFTRVIVHPDGHREVEGMTPKSLPAPDVSHALPRPTDPTDDTNEGAA